MRHHSYFHLALVHWDRSRCCTASGLVTKTLHGMGRTPLSRSLRRGHNCPKAYMMPVPWLSPGHGRKRFTIYMVKGRETNILTSTEREVKKANRELHTQTSKMSDMQKIDHLHKRCSDLLAEMKRHERESIKNKKRGDQLQKEKDSSRNELSKQITLKEKLEKLCREIQRENNKLKVIRFTRTL